MSSEEETREERKEEKGDNTEAELEIFQRLCISPPGKTVEKEATTYDLATTLSSELAALECKRGILISELEKMKNLVISRDQRVMELQMEGDQLREQAARQSAIVLSLKKRVQELEERERNRYASEQRNEIALQGLRRDLKSREEEIREYEKKVEQLEKTVSEEVRSKERVRSSFQEFARKLVNALNAFNDTEYGETVHPRPEMVMLKVEELVQEASRLRANNTNVEARLTTVELEFRSCRDALDRAVAEKEQLQRQLSSQLIDLDRLKEDKECLEMRYRIAERELNGFRDKLINANKSITTASGNISNQEALIVQLREDLKEREEKGQRVETELRHLLESFAMLVSGPGRFVESHENAIKDRIREILAENKDQALTIENLREKVKVGSESASRQGEFIQSMVANMRNLEDERSKLQSKIGKLECELTDCQFSKESLRRNGETLVTFLERLAKAMQIDDISEQMGLDLRMESLVIRAEQLARLETDRLVDKTSVVYQLQRRVRTLREQLQRRDLHLDLLRRKLSLQEDSVKMKSWLQNERDEANLRAKKLSKQIDRLQIQLSEERSRNRELSAQLTEAADYKIAALERSRKIEELQKRLIESEMLRTRCNRKLTMLKEQMRTSGETAEQERSISDHSLQLLRDELAQVKLNLSDLTKRESQLQSFRVSVVKLLSEPICTPDYEIISRLQKMVAVHRDFTILSRRYEDPLETSPSRCTSVHTIHPPRSPGSRCTRYEDVDVEDEFAKRPVPSSLLP